MRVLIVDDEDTVREGLRAVIDWGTHGFSICGEGSDGEEGLGKMLEMRPDLVLLDIKMPAMGGIEAAERARKAGFTGKIIILSGYSDFKYAQSAIRQGVTAYLLKPVDEDELTDAVSKVRSEIEEEKLALAMDREKQGLIRGSVLGDIFQGRRSAADHMDVLGMRHGFYRVAALECADTALLDELFGAFNDMEPVGIGGRNFLILKGQAGESLFRRSVKALSRRLEEAGAFIGLGSAVNSFHDIEKSYREAENLLENRFFIRTEGETMYATGFNAMNCQGKLHLCIVFGETDMISTLLEELRAYCVRSGMGQEKAKGFLAEFYSETMKRIRQEHPELGEELPNYVDVNNRMFEQKNLDGVILWFGEDFRRFSALIGCRSLTDAAEKLRHYVDKYYYLNVNLETLAGIFGYNSAYLGRAFHVAAGETFNSYIDRIKIMHAKVFLENTKLKISEISEKVGFSSYIYFHKKFVRYTGKSPNEYRKLKGGSEPGI
jgi:two-component system response regulator YesN